jgi:transposase
VETLRQVWVQQFWLDNEQVRQRDVEDMPPVGAWIRSPYDTEARYCTKRTTGWLGYRVHLTETCDEKTPRIITQVTTMPATVQDDDALEVIQADLHAKNLLPEQQFVDEGYVDADNLVKSRTRYQIDLVGPAPKDTTWQAQHEQGLDSTQFFIDWDNRQVTCPEGTSIKHGMTQPIVTENPSAGYCLIPMFATLVCSGNSVHMAKGRVA